MASPGIQARDTEPVEAFIARIQSTGLGSEQDARSQVFAPTCCPDEIVVSPGIVMRKPDSMEYAPNIDIAEAKILALRGQAKAGKIAVTNITMEPGMGKTIHLPFKFRDSKVLVVLPTLFDAWSAKLAATQPAILTSFGYTSDVVSNVTYTDSYYAAYLITTGKIATYDVVFVDESHSADGVTTFMASAVVPGVSFVRLTATPKSVNTQPRRSFPIMDELAAPELTDVTAVGEFVSMRTEERKLVMTPSPHAAELVASAVPGSILLTKRSSPSDVLSVMRNQEGPSTIVTDASCGKGINLNLDFVLDFATVETPNGIRKITVPEQQQRRARVGRLRPGVYCCPYRAINRYYEDHFSLFRSNLWCVINDLRPFDCDLPPVAKSRAFKLLRMITEPATVPHESPILSSSESSAEGDFVSVAPQTPTRSAQANREVQIEDDVTKLSLSDDDTVPSWAKYYLCADNHPNVYIGDMIFDHRRLSKSLLIAPDLPVKPAVNFVQSGPVKDGKGEGRTYSSSLGNPVLHRRMSSSGRSSETMTDRLSRKYGGHEHREAEDGAPLRLKRASKAVHGKLGTVYKALSVSGDYLVEAGMVVAESGRVHDMLRPLPTKLVAALSSDYADRNLGRATTYLSWVVARPLVVVDAGLEVSSFSAMNAWNIPPVSEVPLVDLQSEYHSVWTKILTSRVNNRQVLPTVVPAVGWPRRTSRSSSNNVLLDALEVCDDPTYSVSEQQLVYRAWNIVATKSSSIAPCAGQVFADALVLLTYMASADRLYRVS